MAMSPISLSGGEVLSPILDDLNEPQRRAVTHGEGPLLVLAGAGTGKTGVITRRIAWLIAAKRARPSQILALTFTDKAAAEMEARVDVLVPYGYADVTISTFHAFGRRLLAEYALLLGLPGEPRILDEAEGLVFLREHLFELPLARLRPLGDPTKHLAALLGAVNRARDEAVSPEEYAAYARRLAAAAGDDATREAAAEQAEIAAFYGTYLELLGAHGLCDYGQLMWLSLRLLTDHARVRREVGERYRYVLVDEFQDTNVAQFRLLQALGEAHRNLTVVGDDDQSIYRFRGAAYANLAQFVDAYPDTARAVLVDNYRSTQPILDAAYRLIRHNDPDRLEARIGVDKRLVARAAHAAGAPPEFHWFDTASTEADFIARRVREAVETGRRRWGDFAVLARTHLIARPLLQALAYRDVPHRYTGNQGLYDADEVRLCAHLLRAVADPGVSTALYHLAGSEVYRVPARDLAALAGTARRRNRALLEVAEAALAAGQAPGETPLSEAAREPLGECLRDLAWLREAAVTRPTGEVLYRFLERSRWLERLSGSAEPADERKVQNLARFFEVARGFSLLAPEDRVPHFVRHLELLREAGDSPPQAEPDDDQDAVQVLTVHRAKGLEFPVVFLAGLTQGRFPGSARGTPLDFPEALLREAPPQGDAHLQEERRLFYVGMTRAREQLVLTGARDLGGKRPAKPSRFVAEALNLAAPPGDARKASALEALARHAPDARGPEPELAPIPDDEPLSLSQEQIADYLACPLKYKYAHVLRVPLLPHHGVVYGLALHNAIRAYYRHVLNGWPVTVDDVLAAYAASWRSEGFLTREHEESRFAAGRAALVRFCERESRAATRPDAVEREFRFKVGVDLVRGRFDRVDLRPEGPVIVDFKSAEVHDPDKARERAEQSLQLRIYALAYREQFSAAPAAAELHFVDTGLVGRVEFAEAAFTAARAAIGQAAAGIRRREFGAAPSYAACLQCAFREVCPARYGG
jgi:DNA helicase-2/ATP-dependent DNA helicase PcrA